MRLAHGNNTIIIYTTEITRVEISLDNFRKSPYIERPLAKLFLELLEENMWSDEFLLYGMFHSENKASESDTIRIIHTLFPIYNGIGSITIESSDGIHTVLGVVQLIQTEFNKNEAANQSVVEKLLRENSNIKIHSRNMQSCVAEAYIKSKFPSISLVRKVICKDISKYIFFLDEENNRYLYIQIPLEVNNNETPIYQLKIKDGKPDNPLLFIVREMSLGGSMELAEAM
jgi:hypothetical protein